MYVFQDTLFKFSTTAGSASTVLPLRTVKEKPSREQSLIDMISFPRSSIIFGVRISLTSVNSQMAELI